MKKEGGRPSRFAAAARPSTIEAHSIAESQLWKSRK